MTAKQKKYVVIAAVVLLLTTTTVLKVSAAENIIKHFEGEYLDAYIDPVGIPTIGYGTIRNPDENRPVRLGDRISQDTALRWLRLETAKIIPQIRARVKVPLKQSELDALTSFVYNVGIGAFTKSTLLRKLNAGAPKREVADEFLRWDKGRKNGVLVTLPGLTRRRIAERQLFLS
jgi:lysozyme